MENKDSNARLFKKLEKIFKFNKTNEDKQLFVPKELAEQIVCDIDLKPKPKVKKPTPVAKEIFAPTTTARNIFDFTDISDVDPIVEIQRPVKPENEKTFSSRIFQLFNIAREHKMDCLTINQITSAYYKVYTQNEKDGIRTKSQIAGEMYNLDYRKVKNAQNAHLVKIGGKASTYKMSNY